MADIHSIFTSRSNYPDVAEGDSHIGMNEASVYSSGDGLAIEPPSTKRSNHRQPGFDQQ